MHAVKGKIPTKTLNTFKIMRVPLEKVSCKLSIEHSLQVDLWWSDDKYTDKYPRNQDTQASLLDEPTACSRPQGVIYSRSREDKEERHHPLVKELYMKGRRETGRSVLYMPTVKVKEPVAMKEEY